jgi:hypothetical protein
LNEDVLVLFLRAGDGIEYFAVRFRDEDESHCVSESVCVSTYSYRNSTIVALRPFTQGAQDTGDKAYLITACAVRRYPSEGWTRVTLMLTTRSPRANLAGDQSLRMQIGCPSHDRCSPA